MYGSWAPYSVLVVKLDPLRAVQPGGHNQEPLDTNGSWKCPMLRSPFPGLRKDLNLWIIHASAGPMQTSPLGKLIRPKASGAQRYNQASLGRRGVTREPQEVLPGNLIRAPLPCKLSLDPHKTRSYSFVAEPVATAPEFLTGFKLRLDSSSLSAPQLFSP